MKSVIIIFALFLAATQGYSVRGRVPVQAGGRIFYGEDAVNGQFPHMVHLTPPGCGGGLISDKWVVSAAHCFNSLPVTARLGDVNLSSSPVIVNVVKYYHHPIWAQGDIDYDITLLELEKSLTFTANIKPIRIPSSPDELFEGELAVLSGFGINEIFQSPSLLQYMYQTVLTQAKCVELGLWPTETLLCTMGPSDLQTVCGGDSGGPLIVKRPEGDLLIGIVNFTYRECIGETPNGYAKPHYFLNWIRNTTGLDI